jgi:GT2 family glycosyltransferase
MKIAVAIATRNRPQWLRMFLLQMANQTIRPDIVVVHENGQPRSMKDELFFDIPIKTEFLYSAAKQVPPDYAIPALKRAIEFIPDVIFLMNDDNIYFA